MIARYCLGCGRKFVSKKARDNHEKGCWKFKNGDKPKVKRSGGGDDL